MTARALTLTMRCGLIPTMMATRGGYREEAGRKSAFPGVDLKPFAMDFTPDGLKRLDRLRRKTGLTRNNILAHLTREYADRLAFDEPGVVYPGKAQVVLSIRMPKSIGARLRAAQKRTGKSYSDLGEALVTQYGDAATYPELPPRKRDLAKPRRAKRRRRLA